MSDWQKALTDQVARNIEHYRLLRGISRTALAARCDGLGLPTKRPALAALLDQRRRTITLQEIVVLADALGVSVAELIVPLHSGEAAVRGPSEFEHAIDAAMHLFAIGSGARSEHDPYQPFLRYRRAADRFERANRRLADLSHALAMGTENPQYVDGRPHPASEILAAEGALSRLVDAHHDLNAADVKPPPIGERFLFLENDIRDFELPLLDNLPAGAQKFLPLYLYRHHADHLPSARLVTQ